MKWEVCTPHAGAAIVRLMLRDALAGKALARLSVAHTVHNVGRICAGVAQLVQKLVFHLDILKNTKPDVSIYWSC